MTNFENMTFEEINSITKSRWLTSGEERKIKELGIISVKKHDHICSSCRRLRDCYLESRFAGLEADVKRCKFYEKQSY